MLTGKRNLMLITALSLAAALWLVPALKRGSAPAVLRVAMPLSEQASYYDPARTHKAVGQYFFLENICTPLLEYSPEGELVSAVADHFEWAGTEARFSMNRNLRTVDGRRINAYDVETSLKRLFILDGQSHVDLEEALCGKQLPAWGTAAPG